MAPRQATATGVDCLSADEITSLLKGDASASERERWMMHLDDCRACRTVLSESAQHLAASIDAGGTRPRKLWWRRRALVGLIGFILVLVIFLLLRRASAQLPAHLVYDTSGEGNR